jgi:hypothetical protein
MGHTRLPPPNNGLIVAGARFVRKIIDGVGFNVETVRVSAGGGGLGQVAKELADIGRLLGQMPGHCSAMRALY